MQLPSADDTSQQNEASEPAPSSETFAIEHGAVTAAAEQGDATLHKVLIQFDGGSNVCLIKSPAAKQLIGTRPSSVEVQGFSTCSKKKFEEEMSVRFTFANGRSVDVMEAFYSEGARRNIMPESHLAKHYSIRVDKVDCLIKWPDGVTMPIDEDNGLYFVNVSLAPVPAGDGNTRSTAEASTAVKADDAALLAAARMNVDSAGLHKLTQVVHNLDVHNVSKAAAELIDTYKYRRFEVARNKHVHYTPANKRAERPGEVFICDGFGKHHAESPIDRATYSFHAVCEYSSYGYVAVGTTHTVDDWVSFIGTVVRDAERHKHRVLAVRFDRAPELRSDDIKDKLEQRFHIEVELTARRHHEGVGAAEVNNDILTRMAEADLQRAKKGTSFLLPARVYAQHRLNFKPCAPHKESRFQRYTSKVPILDPQRPLHLWGTSVMYTEEKAARGPKGSLTKPRASEGMLVGVDGKGAAYLVYGKRGNTAQPRFVDPLDELQLLRRGIASSAAHVDVDTQTPDGGVPTPPPVPPPPKPKPPPPIVYLKVGDRVSVKWLPHKKGDAAQDYHGTVTTVVDKQGGQRLWGVKYDSWDAVYYHDFINTKREWRELPSELDQNRSDGRTDGGDVAPTGKSKPRGDMVPGPRTRARSRALHAHLAVEAALDSCATAEQLDVFNATLYQALGDAGDDLSCASIEQMHDARSRLHRRALYGIAKPILQAENPQATAQQVCSAAYECAKASQSAVHVNTPLGEAVYHVPRTKLDVQRSPQREQWLEADRRALDSILRAGNRLVKISLAKALGAVVARTVTTRKMKIDQDTKELDKHDPFKSRHAFDDTFINKQRTIDSPSSTATIVDDLTSNLFLAAAAKFDAILTKGDVKDAYAKGTKINRGVSYMSLPSTLPMVDEDGDELCIELTSPMWGESEAGYEWQCTFNSALEAMGWKPCEGVPAMFRYEDATGVAHMITCVDDFLMSDRGDGSITAATTAAIKAAFDGEVKLDYDPTSFLGRRITRDRERRTLKVSMPLKVEEAVLEHLPDLAAGKSLGLPPAKQVLDMADSMTLAPRAPGAKLTSEQSRTQQIIGSLKFIEKVMPRISLVVHRLSCVMSSPPPEALIVAKAALAMAYKERHVGVTYGGDGPTDDSRLSGRLSANISLDEPAAATLEASADATWGERNLYGLLVTYNRATVLFMVKKIQLLVDSSHEAEAIGTSKVAEEVSYAREVLRALDDAPEHPTIVLTDNKANALVAADARSASRSKHFLRRYVTLQQRIASAELIVVKVEDANMPSDFLTKWLPSAKLRKSVAYATNSHTRAP